MERKYTRCWLLDAKIRRVFSCRHPATAWLLALGSRPCRHTLLSTHRACASIPPLPAPRLPLSDLTQLASVPPIICASVCLLLDIHLPISSLRSLENRDPQEIG